MGPDDLIVVANQGPVVLVRCAPPTNFFPLGRLSLSSTSAALRSSCRRLLNIFNMVLELYFSNTYPCAQDENSLAWSKVRTF